MFIDIVVIMETVQLKTKVNSLYIHQKAQTTSDRL